MALAERCEMRSNESNRTNLRMFSARMKEVAKRRDEDGAITDLIKLTNVDVVVDAAELINRTNRTVSR